MAWFSKKTTAMDAVVRAIYGDQPPKKSADVDDATKIAHEDLLVEEVPIGDVKKLAAALFAGPMPYSTHDLALSVALSFLKDQNHFEVFKEIQLWARYLALEWTQEGLVAPGILQVFEGQLYRIYGASNDGDVSHRQKGQDETQKEPSERGHGLIDGIRFLQAATQWSSASGSIPDVKLRCRDAGIEAEHRAANDAVLEVSFCVMELAQVRDYATMLDLERKLFAAGESVMKAMRQLSEAANIRKVDLSATAPLVKALVEVLEARGMLKR